MPYGIAPYPVSFASMRQGMVYCISWNAIELCMKSRQSMTQMHASLFLARCLRPAPVQRDSITAIRKIGFGARFVQQSKNRFLLPSQRKKRCSSGALWDVLASCEISGAADHSIRNPILNDFSSIFSVAAIQAVFTTGKTAARLYRNLSGSTCFCLPSPSPANCAVALEDLIQAYRAIVPYLKKE